MAETSAQVAILEAAEAASAAAAAAAANSAANTLTITESSTSTSTSTLTSTLTSTTSSLPIIAVVEEFFRNYGDKRVENLRFMSNPWEVFFISLFYVYFCYDLGPKRLMKNRQAFNLVWTVRIFNTCILLLNVWLLSKFFTLHNWGYDIVGCAPVYEHDRSAKTLEHINVCHIFLYSRILELIDTLWICLRKKNRQITFLHVFHHSFVLNMTWLYFKLAPGGSSAMFPIVNGMVHTIMYVYYILSTFEAMKPYLWWKKYVTTIQLIQFIILGLHFAVAALTPSCEYPRALSLSGLAIASMFFTLFIAFYRETYNANSKRAALANQAIKTTNLSAERQREFDAKTALLCEDKNNNNNNNYIDNNLNNNNNYYSHPNYNAKFAEAAKSK